MDTEETLDVRVAHSRATLKSELVRLLADQDIASISISALCKAAGVSRPTFYQHFGSIDDIYAAVVRDRLRAVRRRVDRTGTVDGIHDSLTRALAFLQEHREELERTLDPGLGTPKARETTMAWLREEVARTLFGTELEDLEPEQRVRVGFAVGGLASTFVSQLRSVEGADLDPDRIAAIVRESILAVLGPVLPKG